VAQQRAEPRNPKPAPSARELPQLWARACKPIHAHVRDLPPQNARGRQVASRGQGPWVMSHHSEPLSHGALLAVSRGHANTVRACQRSVGARRRTADRRKLHTCLQFLSLNFRRRGQFWAMMPRESSVATEGLAVALEHELVHALEARQELSGAAGRAPPWPSGTGFSG